MKQALEGYLEVGGTSHRSHTDWCMLALLTAVLHVHECSGGTQPSGADIMRKKKTIALRSAGIGCNAGSVVSIRHNCKGWGWHGEGGNPG